jgi:hypothetical protein
MSEPPIRQRVYPSYGFHVCDAELDADMKPAEIAEALSMLTFTTGDSRRTIGLDRETCRRLKGESIRFLYLFARAAPAKRTSAQWALERATLLTPMMASASAAWT